MNAFDSVAEIDWPKSTGQKRLYAQLDDALLCSICRDHFDTPLSLICGHSFCAECIRSNIQYQERACGKAHCPQCRQATDSRQIHPNHQLREVVKHYLLARPHLIAAVATADQAEGPPRKRTRLTRDSDTAAKARIRQQTRCQSEIEGVIDLESASEDGTPQRELRKRSAPVDYAQSEDESQDDPSSASEDVFGEADLAESSPTPRKKPKKSDSDDLGPGKKKSGKLPSNWALCPVCSQSFPLAIFNDHLDKCLEGHLAEEAGIDSVGGAQTGSGTGSKPKLTVPPKLLLSLEKPNALRDRLKRYGLSTKGSRQELEQRYTRFRVEVQTALDRNEVGATYASLARRVSSRETSESNASARPVILRTGPAKKPPAFKEEAGFDDLIRATRARTAAKAQEDLRPAHQANDQDAREEGFTDAAGDLAQRGGVLEDQHQARSEGQNIGEQSQWGRGFRRQSCAKAGCGAEGAEDRRSPSNSSDQDLSELVEDSDQELGANLLPDRRIAQLSQ